MVIKKHLFFNKTYYKLFGLVYQGYGRNFNFNEVKVKVEE